MSFGSRGNDRRFVVDEVMNQAQGARKMPVFTINQIADYLNNGYWRDEGQAARSWAPNHDVITFDVSSISPVRMEMARLAFAAWSEVTNLTFTEVFGGSDIHFTQLGNNRAVTNMTTSGKTLTHAEINVSLDWSSSTNVDSYLYQTFVHEIGHALGLGHGGHYNFDAQYGVDNHYKNDTWQYSAMSYMGQGNYGGASTRYVMTPQMADIQAVIGKYGAAQTRVGDTTYGFNVAGQNAQTGQLYDFDNYTQAPAFTIYDSGGDDTLDCSEYMAAQRIDLMGGAWSDVGGLTANIGIYRTAVIENARGGGGADRLFGNNAANTLFGMDGVDILGGRAGADTLEGGSQADSFQFRRHWGRDTVLDFEDAVDRMDLRAFDLGFGKVKKLAMEFGDDLVLNFGRGDRLTIIDFSKAEFDVTDVLL